MAGIFPLDKPDWSNVDIIHRNTLPPRSYFFLHSQEQDGLSSNIVGDCAMALNGVWKFDFSNSPFEAPPNFHETEFDASSWADIKVPGHWQLQGWGKPHYSNINYIFPVDPPHVPFVGNQTGSYIKHFSIPRSFHGQQLRIRFEGVDAAFHMYLNGREIGYSQGSRNPDEFDITSVAELDSNNVLAVRVYRWCDGSYLEDQDQWRLSGIFRDVFLLAFPSTHIKDFQTQTLLDDDFKDAKLRVKVHTTGQGLLGAKLLNAAQGLIAKLSAKSDETGTTELVLPVKEPKKWSAEDPYLYKLVLSFGGRFVVQNVGFRRIDIKNGILKVNGNRIVFRGVNRHEHHPVHGRAVPYEYMKQDLLLMKRHNINAIRTCHQPCHPRFFSLADELGFWVMDEADLECHGFLAIESLLLTCNAHRPKPGRFLDLPL